MPGEIEDIVAVRREIWDLLQRQMETLRSSQELSDLQLMECYHRQVRVQKLREQIETLTCASVDVPSMLEEPILHPVEATA